LPSKQDLRRRIRSVRSTEQITKAMQMVAAAKLRRAHTRILEARPYAAALEAVLRSLASRVASHRHELLVERPEHAVTLVVVTADKGLCGAFNANILREAMALLEGKRWQKVELVLVGRRGIDFFRRRSYVTISTHAELMRAVTPEAAFDLARTLATRFAAGETDAIYLLYNHFRSIMRQEMTLERLLPIERAKITGGERPAAYIFEPSPQALLGQILPRHVQFQMLRALLDSQAAEQASRMTAMDAASKNAADMIDGLTLTYNRMRQAAITKELIEIVSGAQALAKS
jgi:F-type H+-transporting ATPase subunit gamma